MLELLFKTRRTFLSRLSGSSCSSGFTSLFLAGGLLGLSSGAFAQGLPTLEDPTRGTGGGILSTLQNYGYDIIMLVALLVIACMFIGVCYHAYMVYSEIHTGKKTWGQFGLTVAVGAMLLVLGIWLLTEATGIL